jgi:hypothetical protein
MLFDSLESGMKKPVEDTLALRTLEEAARRLGYAVRYERFDNDDVKISSGFCRVKDEKIIIIDKRLDIKNRWAALANTLKKMDLNSAFLPPLARELLDMN